MDAYDGEHSRLGSRLMGRSYCVCLPGNMFKYPRPPVLQGDLPAVNARPLLLLGGQP